MRNMIRKSMAYIICISMVVLLVLGTAYTIGHIHHDCNAHSVEGTCTICIQIKKIQHAINQITGAKSSSFDAVLPLYIACMILLYQLFAMRNITPITLKVRMDN